MDNRIENIVGHPIEDDPWIEVSIPRRDLRTLEDGYVLTIAGPGCWEQYYLNLGCIIRKRRYNKRHWWGHKIEYHLTTDFTDLPGRVRDNYIRILREQIRKIQGI